MSKPSGFGAALCFEDLSDSDHGRFVKRVDTSAGCWNWQGFVHPSGYGMLKVKRRMLGAHRIAAIRVYGPLAPGEVVMHLCDNRRCVNPVHLEVGTHQDNMRDMDRKGRRATGRRNGGWVVAKLTMDKAREIRAQRAAGRSRAAIAADFGVSASNVWLVESNKTWREE